MTRTVAVATVGCRLNQVESQELQAALEGRGFTVVPFEDGADVVVVNTCTVTSRADVSDRQLIHRAVRHNPAARVVVTGCWAQTDPAAAAALPGVALVVGNADKPDLPELVTRISRAPAAPVGIHVSDVAGLRTMPATSLARVRGRSRAFVKVQDGCQHRCAFCIVPLARGGSRSQEPKVVVDQVRQLTQAGYRDVTLTGVDLGHYGWDLYPRTTLAALLTDLADAPGLWSLRLSSILPAYFSSTLIDVIARSPVIAPHLHVPLQSGSDRILRRMRRPYTAGMYRRLVDRLAAAIPGLALGADVIVGFPGETDGDFEETVGIVAALPFTYLHVFGYSDRRGTEAVARGGHVEPRVIAARSRRLRELARAKNLAFRQGLVGATQEAIVLETRDRRTGRLVGLTGNYVEVLFEGPASLVRQVVRLRVTAAGPAVTHGEIA